MQFISTILAELNIGCPIQTPKYGLKQLERQDRSESKDADGDNMAKKKFSFADLLQKKIDQHNKRAARNAALFRAEQKRQGLAPDQPISLLDMVKNMEKRKK